MRRRLGFWVLGGESGETEGGSEQRELWWNGLKAAAQVEEIFLWAHAFTYVWDLTPDGLQTHRSETVTRLAGCLRRLCREW
jgi:hypothetical protein